MKPRLSHILLSALLVCGTYQAQATRTKTLDAGYVKTVTGEETVVLSTSGEGMNQAKFRPYVKDGEGTLNIKESGSMNAALFVREGKVVAGNGKDAAQINITLAPVSTNSYSKIPLTNWGTEYLSLGASTSVSVGGKNAQLELNNVRLKSATASSMVVGSLDGSGSLTVTGGSVVDNMSASGIHLIIGGVADGKTNYYNAHVHETTGYSSGTYATMSDGATKIGSGSVTVSDGSKFLAGTNGVILGEGTLNISGKSAVYAGHNGGTYANDLPASACGQADEWETSIGALNNATSNLNISGGSVFNTGVGLKIASFDGSKATISIDGENSRLEMASSTTKTYIGYKFALATGNNKYTGYNYTWKLDSDSTANSTTKIDLTKGGAMVLNDVYMGNSEGSATVTVAIDEQSSFSAKNLEVYTGASITNDGTLTATELVLLGGSLENSGTLEADVEMSGGVFTMCDGATAQGLTATAGTVNISGNVTFSGVVNFGTVTSPLMMFGSSESTTPLTINIEQGSTIKMEDVALNIGSGVIFNVDLVGDSKLDEGEALFTIDYGNLDSAYVEEQLNQTSTTLSHNGNVVTTIEPGSLNINADGSASLQVPEPTTATLSLLALAGLAMRRRRK